MFNLVAMRLKDGTILEFHHTGEKSFERFYNPYLIKLMDSKLNVIKNLDIQMNGWYDHEEMIRAYEDMYSTKNAKETGASDTNCWHKWKLYTGLVETFEYCEKCDVKRSDVEC